MNNIKIYKVFGNESEEFSLEYLKEKGNIPVKFIQVYLEGVPHIRIGEMYHKNLLSKFLTENNLNCTLRESTLGDMIPNEDGSKYQMVGAGKVRFFNEIDSFNFYDISTHYADSIKGTDKKHLEDFFGKNKVFEKEELSKHPFFIVNI